MKINFLLSICFLGLINQYSNGIPLASATALSLSTANNLNPAANSFVPSIFHFVSNVERVSSKQMTAGFSCYSDTINGNGYPKKLASEYEAPSSYPGLSLKWSDEFNGGKLNEKTWSYETGNSGWGNSELENYTNSPKNCFVTKDGYLVIEARKEKVGNNIYYTSARLQTKGKKEFKYGRMDIRAKLPKGQGIWPAIWMLGSNISTTSWPGCGEIDIMELLGHEPNKVYGTMHWGKPGGGSTHVGGTYTLPAGDFSQKFHVFSIQWDSTKIEWFVDGNKYFTGNKSDVNGNYPFDQPFFFLLNVAVGGNWPGNPDASTVFPQKMIVDYVRVFQ